MGHQKKRPMLEPVLENYMGPPISYNTPASKPPRHSAGTAKVAPASEPAKHHHDSSKGIAASLNPLHLFGKLRDRYIKAMNEMSMGGDLASVAGYHGGVAGTDFPGTVEQHHRSSTRGKEIRALREELAARRRKSEGLVEESDDEDLGVAECHHHQYKPSHKSIESYVDEASTFRAYYEMVAEVEDGIFGNKVPRNKRMQEEPNEIDELVDVTICGE